MYELIEELPELPQAIIDAEKRNEFAIFIGAGVSRSVGCSGWDQLAANLLQRCESEGHMNNFVKETLSRGTDYKKTITICSQLLDPRDFLEVMKEALNDDTKYEVKVSKDNPNLEKIYKPLVQLNGVFVTTNADRHIDQLFFPEQIIVDNFSRSTEISNKHLYKIHGSITEPDSLVFSVKGYLERYTQEGLPSFLHKLFGSYTILFIGYGLSEFELLDHLFKANGGIRRKHFFLKDYYTHEKQIYQFEQLYFDHLNIDLIPYAKDTKGFVQLEDIVNNWVNQMKSTSTAIHRNFAFIDQVLGSPL